MPGSTVSLEGNDPLPVPVVLELALADAGMSEPVIGLLTTGTVERMLEHVLEQEAAQ
jgi:hypothetical protein